MNEQQRATVSVVRDTGSVPPHVTEPEAAPPDLGAAAPPEELENDIGGPVVNPPQAEDIVRAEGGSMADRMRARFESMESTKEFGVPGWDLPDGSPGLIVEARTFGDRKAYNTGISNEAFIARSTHRLLFVNDDGSREEVPGKWGPTLADMIGARGITKAADLVARVISKPDPDNEGQRIPNVAGIGVLATQIINWAGAVQNQAEEDLGE